MRECTRISPQRARPRSTLSVGKASRDKGGRNERLLVQHLTHLGHSAHRVPLSGAMRNYKADVICGDIKIEVKSRKCSFTKIYAMLNGTSSVRFEYDGVCVYVTHSFALATSVMREGGSFPKETSVSHRRIVKMRGLLGEATVLAIKDDRQPFLFIVYL